MLHASFSEGKPRMTYSISDLIEHSRKPSRIVAGLMSGTSADSIDVTPGSERPKQPPAFAKTESDAVCLGMRDLPKASPERL
jgi:hypothetical protein